MATQMITFRPQTRPVTAKLLNLVERIRSKFQKPLKELLDVYSETDPQIDIQFQFRKVYIHAVKYDQYGFWEIRDYGDVRFTIPIVEDNDDELW